MLLLLLLILFAGCARVPKDEAECGLMKMPQLQETQQLHTDAISRGDYPQDSWWEMFEDAQLSCLIERALVDSPTMKLAMSRVAASEEMAKVKKSSLFPMLGFSADVDWRYLGINDFFRAFAPTIPGNITEYEIDVDFSYEFDFWGKHRNTYRAALGRARAECAEAASARLFIATSVAATYFKLQATRHKLAFLQEERELYTSLFELTALREKHAVDNRFPVIGAEEALIALNKNILLAETKISIQMHMLKILLGESPESCEKIEEIVLSSIYKVPMPECISSNLLARRPDLMSQIWLVEAAAHEVGAAKAAFYPSINLYALAGLDSVFFRKFFRWESRAAQLEPALNLPIFTGGKLRASLREKRALFEGAMHKYNELLLQAASQVSDAALILKTSDETLSLQTGQVGNFERARNLTVNRYQNSLDTRMQVIRAEESVLREKLIEIQNQYKRYLAAITLVKSLGGGYIAPSLPLEPRK